MTDDILGSSKEDVLIEEKVSTKEPKQFKVILHNDDYTPMEFVVHILQKFFQKKQHEAEKIMMLVHNTGIGLCGIYPKEIAETKVFIVNEYSKKNQHPLKCSMEKE